MCKIDTYKKYCRFISPLTNRYNRFDVIYPIFIKNKIFTANEMKSFTRQRWREEIDRYINLDHKLSIAWGYRHKVPPAIMRHPCNCEFMLIDKNTRKGCRNSISFNELIEDIRCKDKHFDVNYHLLFCH